MPAIGAEDLAALRDQFQWSEFYLGVLVPATVHTSRINYAAIPRGARDITFDGGAYGTGFAFANVVAGMTLWVGSEPDTHDRCKLRIKNFSGGPAAGTITVAEHEYVIYDDDYLTIKEEFRLWSRHPRAQASGVLVHWWMDWDVSYSGQNKDAQREPIVRMGPPAAAIIDSDTGLATVRFWSDSGAAPGGNAPSSYSWSWRGGTPATAATAGTSGSPHTVTWSAAGNYLATLTLDGTTSGYRPVFIFDSTGANAPYQAFEVESISGDFNTGGWRMTVRVKEECAEADFPEESMVVLFARDWYRGTEVSLGGNYTHRENIIFCGYITKESVRRDPETNDVLFEAHTIDGEMRNVEIFPHSLEDHPNADNNWLQIEDMNMDKAAYHILRWKSTLLEVADVHFSGDTKRIRWLDVTQKSLYEQIDGDCYKDAILGRCLSDRMGLVHCELDPQFLPHDATRDAIATIMEVEEQDWRDQIDLPAQQAALCSQVYASGVSYAGNLADVEPICTLALGDALAERGRAMQVERLVFEDQDQANQISGDILAQRNNPYTNIRVPIGLNYRVFDIAPQEWVTMPIEADDTYRGIEWDDERRFLPRRVDFRLDNAIGALNADVGLEMESSGTAGVYTDCPSAPSVPDYVPPASPEYPSDLVLNDWNGIWLVGMWGSRAGSTPGIMRTENLGGPATVPPTWAAWNTGLDMVNYPYCHGLGRDPWHPNTRLYCLMSGADADDPGQGGTPGLAGPAWIGGDKIYRREYSAGTWGDWTEILNQTIVEATIGRSLDRCRLSHQTGNINADGHLYVAVYGQFLASPSQGRFYFFKSTDYGDTWACPSNYLLFSSGSLIRRDAYSCRAGMHQGTSGFGAGQVIWASVNNIWLYVSTDQGTSFTLRNSITADGYRLMVDPNDQSICFAMVANWGDPPWAAVVKYTSHGTSKATMGAFGNVARALVARVGEADTIGAARGTDYGLSYDGGTTVNSISVPGNICGGGLPLNWNFGKLMAIHSWGNGVNGTAYFQVSPDGGTTWYNRHGNLPSNARGLVNVGYGLTV